MDQNLEEIFKKAREAGACSDGLEWIKTCQTLEEAFNHPEASAWAYWYAIYAIKGRWPEGEAAIAKNCDLARMYAIHIKAAAARARAAGDL